MSKIDLSPAAIREYSGRPYLTDQACIVIATLIEYDDDLWNMIHKITDRACEQHGWDGGEDD